MTRALVLGAAALALSASAALAQTVNPNTATGPLYNYAGPASSAPLHGTPRGYGPLIYTPQLFAPTPAFPAADEARLLHRKVSRGFTAV